VAAFSECRTKHFNETSPLNADFLKWERVIYKHTHIHTDIYTSKY